MAKGTKTTRRRISKAAVAKTIAVDDDSESNILNFSDPIVVPVMAGKPAVLTEVSLNPRQKVALLDMAPELYRVCVSIRAFLGGSGRDPKDVLRMLDEVLAKATPKSP